jgi:acyl-CoA synthetase (AMP-forming)/AMP-acid ligase II
MEGYLENPTATAEAFRGGSLHLAGGENISSREVEDVRYRRRAVGFLPQSSTGKIQKFVLRARAREVR